MDEREREEQARQILGELTPFLYERFAAAEWGRILVTIDPEKGVTNIGVEEVVGDEAKVDAAFESAGAQEVLPVLFKVVEALVAMAGCELAEVEGGTFVRQHDGSFAFLPGLVRTPSAGLDRLREEVMPRLEQRNDELASIIGPHDAVELDLEGGRIVFRHGEAERATAVVSILGSFAKAPRMWGWGWSNSTVPEPARKSCAEICDGLPDRDFWEITTPAFASDENTAWLICAYVCDRTGSSGVYRVPHDDGAVFFLVHAIAPPALS
jgi:hypothetical protein